MTTNCPHCSGLCKGDRCDESLLLKSDDLSAAKAREILHDGTVHGHKITDRQRRFMGWVAGGRQKPMKKSMRLVVRVRKSFGTNGETHPMDVHRVVQHQFPGSPHPVNTVLSRTAHNPNAPLLSHLEHSTMAQHHAELGISHLKAGRYAVGQSHLAAAHFHSSQARIKEG